MAWVKRKGNMCFLKIRTRAKMKIMFLNSVNFLKAGATDATWVFRVQEKEGNLFSQCNLLTLHSFWSQVEINLVLFGWKTFGEASAGCTAYFRGALVCTGSSALGRYNTLFFGPDKPGSCSDVVHPVPVAEPLWCPGQTWPTFPWASVPFSMFTGRRWFGQHPPELWNRVGWRVAGCPHEKADWICRHQRRWYGISAVIWEQTWVAWNEIHLPSTSLSKFNLGGPQQNDGIWGPRHCQGQGQEDVTHHMFRVVDRQVYWSSNSYTVWQLPSLSFFWHSQNLIWLSWPWQALRCPKGETTSALNLTQLPDPGEVNYGERRAISDSGHIYLLSTGDTKNDHSLLMNLLWPLDPWIIINSMLAGHPEDMKTFCENIWYSLTQEQAGKKNHQPWDRISFSFHVALWVKEPPLTWSKCEVGVCELPFKF